jgi:hypothetical protein
MITNNHIAVEENNKSKIIWHCKNPLPLHDDYTLCGIELSTEEMIDGKIISGGSIDCPQCIMLIKALQQISKTKLK